MIVGDKVCLCGITKETAPRILEWVNNPSLKKYTGTVFPVSEFEHTKWIEQKTQSQNEKLFIIYLKDNLNTPIGTIGLKNIDYINSNVELYISIANTEYQSTADGNNINKGYGTDAVKTLVSFCFNRLNIHKVYLQVFKSNRRAIRCYEKSGFQVEGILRKHHYDNGEYEDVLIMATLNK